MQQNFQVWVENLEPLSYDGQQIENPTWVGNNQVSLLHTGMPIDREGPIDSKVMEISFSGLGVLPECDQISFVMRDFNITLCFGEYLIKIVQKIWQPNVVANARLQ